MVNTPPAQVLVVDDDPDFRLIVVSILNGLGVDRPLEARHGREGVALYQRHKPRLVFLDMYMPGGMDGMETLRQILAYDNLANVVMLTASSNNYVYDDAIWGGARGFITKGGPGTDLAGAIRQSVSMVLAPQG